MDYLITMLNALLSFVSPCVLPLLTVYIAYFSAGEANRRRTFFNVLGFCAAVTVFYMAIFSVAAYTSESLETYVIKYQNIIYSVAGVMLILFGLKFMGYLSIPFLDKTITINAKTENVNIINAFVLGIAFSLSMGACALGYMSVVLTSFVLGESFIKGLTIGLVFTGVIVLLFIICALFIDKLKGVIKFFQKHNRIINYVAGGILIVLGMIMVLGFMDELTALMTF